MTFQEAILGVGVALSIACVLTWITCRAVIFLVEWLGKVDPNQDDAPASRPVGDRDTPISRSFAMKEGTSTQDALQPSRSEP